MTPEEHVIELMTRANPVPDPSGATLPRRADVYLRELEQRSTVMSLSTLDPDTTEHEPTDRRKSWPILLAAAAVAALVIGLVVMGTRPDDDPIPADRPSTPSTTPVTSPSTDPDDASAIAPGEPIPPVAGAAAEPVPVGFGGILDGGTTYRTSRDPVYGMTPEMTLTIPNDQGEAAWSVLNMFPDEVTFLPLGDWVPAGVREPVFGLAPVTEGVPVADVVASIEAYADADPDFELTVESATIGGDTVSALRGVSSRGTGSDHRIPTSDDSSFSVPPSRSFIVYLIEGPTHVIAAKIESGAAEFDDAVAHVVPILDTIEFT